MLGGAITVDLDESSFISWILHRRFGDHGEYVFFGTINRYMAQVRQRKHMREKLKFRTIDGVDTKRLCFFSYF